MAAGGPAETQLVSQLGGSLGVLKQLNQKASLKLTVEPLTQGALDTRVRAWSCWGRRGDLGAL